jgi:primosomal protein N' (replication factor Y)
VPRYVEVVFPLPLHSSFTYDLPPDLDEVGIGQRVLAPFGKRRLTGYVVDLPAEAGEIETKTIEAVLDDRPLLTPALVSLAKRMARLYGVPLGEAVATMLPPGLGRESRRRVVAVRREGEPIENEDRAWVSRVKKGKGLDYLTLAKRDPASARRVRRLEREGWLEIRSVLRKERSREKKEPSLSVDPSFLSAPAVDLLPAQKKVLNEIASALRSNSGKSFLLHGITGSGKTEIYLQAASVALSEGRRVLALVPEIALTPQFVGRFRARLGKNVAVLHSGRSGSDRLTEWMRIRRGEISVVVGARSAVFAPIEGIGLVIVDEEHDSSYKQDEGLTYHGKALALERAREEGAVSVLGSATPSLETYEAVSRGRHELLELPTRATGQEVPTVALVDLRKEFSQYGEKGLFSEELREGIARTLARGEQTVLFLNRRGFAPLVFCPACGESLRCPDCSVTLTYHRELKRHLCHYCDHSVALDQPCPKCGKVKFVFLGVGTERVEQELRFHFPDARVGRLDRDAVAGKGGHERVLKTLASGEIDILVGTQMVTKGMDFPRVSLVGVLLADQSLHFPDFRAAEQTFQLLTQVVGRSGRGGSRGEAIVQTFQPEHYAIVAAAAQDYKAFFAREIEFRREANYPPYSSLALLEILGKEETAVRTSAIWLGAQARSKIGSGKMGLEVMGPAPAPMKKVKAHSRYHMILRSPRGGDAAAFGRWLLVNAREPLKERGVEIRLDVDPQRFL